MLAQTLNRDFMLGVVEASELQLRAVVRNREHGIFGESGDPGDLDTAELTQLADDLAATLERERAAAGAGAGAGAAGASKDDRAYMPRDARMALIQSRFESAAREQLPTSAAEPWTTAAARRCRS